MKENKRSERTTVLEHSGKICPQAATNRCCPLPSPLTTIFRLRGITLPYIPSSRACPDPLFRIETLRYTPAALEKEVERLRESTVALTQRLLDTVAEAERAGKDERDAIQAKAAEATEAAVAEAEAAVAEAVAAAREEETARCRKEMEATLLEVGGRKPPVYINCGCFLCVCGCAGHAGVGR